MKEYDILNGGLEQFQKDLDDYIKYISFANMEFVSKLSEIGKNDIILNAGLADEFEQVMSIYNETKIVQQSRSNDVSSDLIINNNPKAVFTEFGYGITGKGSPYSYGSTFNMESAGWKGYDLDSNAKKSDRSWWYKDMFGNSHHTKGAIPKNIFYNAYSKIEQSISSVGNEVFNRWSK